MLCLDWYVDCGAEFEQAHADYYDHLIRNNSTIGIERFIWFTLANNEWRNSDLVSKNVPRLAWYEYIKASSILRRGQNSLDYDRIEQAEGHTDK